MKKKQRESLRRPPKSVREVSNHLSISMFAAGLAHELGNPLDATRRYINLALENAMGDPLTREYLLKAKKGILRTIGVMHEFLGHSRECHEYSIKMTEIHALLERSLEGLGAEAEFRDISVHRAFCQDAIYIEDRGLLIALHNLYRNAVQAMKGHGVLTLATWRQNGSVGIAVQDTGGGVPESLKARIFEPFVSTKKRDDGTGIGLALAREIVERCGGELRCENTVEPVPGARFILILPRKKVSADNENDQSLQI